MIHRKALGDATPSGYLLMNGSEIPTYDPSADFGSSGRQVAYTPPDPISAAATGLWRPYVAPPPPPVVPTTNTTSPGYYVAPDGTLTPTTNTVDFGQSGRAIVLTPNDPTAAQAAGVYIPNPTYIPPTPPINPAYYPPQRIDSSPGGAGTFNYRPAPANINVKLPEIARGREGGAAATGGAYIARAAQQQRAQQQQGSEPPLTLAELIKRALAKLKKKPAADGTDGLKGIGAYPSDSYYDPNRPRWLPNWIDTPTESAQKFSAYPGANVNTSYSPPKAGPPPAAPQTAADMITWSPTSMATRNADVWGQWSANSIPAVPTTAEGHGALWLYAGLGVVAFVAVRGFTR